MKWAPIVAILCITLLESIALLQGIDGMIFSLAATIIGGLGGYQAKIARDKLKGGK